MSRHSERPTLAKMVSGSCSGPTAKLLKKSMAPMEGALS
jgi:hypothetical protein